MLVHVVYLHYVFIRTQLFHTYHTGILYALGGHILVSYMLWEDIYWYLICSGRTYTGILYAPGGHILVVIAVACESSKFIYIF